MTPFARAGRALFVLGVAALLSQSCATATRLSAVPDELQSLATVVGFPAEIRYFPRDSVHVKGFEADYRESLDREARWLAGTGVKGPLPPAAYLAISGGGDNGAFGAGLLNGWTANGTRPQFKLVTGVSTGALIAPFAFLGASYDERLKALYTHVSLKDIAERRSLLSVVYGDAIADTAPLHQLVQKYMTQEMLDSIAAEDARGRLLLVATTNLDVRRPVIWNITKIAASKAPGALELVQKILIASSAIPGTFPPVMIDVEAGGRKYQEMHVDGGTTTQVFVYPAALELPKVMERRRSLYIIRNARLDPQWAEVERRTLPIALRAISTLIQHQGMGDLYTIFALAQRDNIDYNLTFIPPTFNTPHPADFDSAYMNALYDVGYRMAGRGFLWWYKRPPVLVSGMGEEQQEY